MSGAQRGAAMQGNVTERNALNTTGLTGASTPAPASPSA
jgi:hypothetical protein